MSSTGTSTPKTKATPFDTRCLTCPKCSISVKARTVKPRLYQRKDLDPDSRPRSYRWANKEFESLNPRKFHIHVCKECGWAADNRSFEDPGKGGGILTKSMISEIKMKEQADQHSTVRCILLEHSFAPAGNDIDITYIEAVSRHLMGLYNQLMLSDVLEREPFHVARYSLRIAWLFRDITEDPKVNKELGSPLQKLLKELKVYWKDLPVSEDGFLEQSLEYYKAAITRSRMIETARDETEFMLVIARILMKLGRVPEAREYLQLGKGKVMSFEQDTKQKAQKEPNQGDAIAEAKAEARRMKLSWDKTQNIFEDIQEAWEEQQIESAQKIIAAHTSMAAEELRTLLIRKKIDKALARKLVPIEKKKKGLFSGLFG